MEITQTARKGDGKGLDCVCVCERPYTSHKASHVHPLSTPLPPSLPGPDSALARSHCLLGVWRNIFFNLWLRWADAQRPCLF